MKALNTIKTISIIFLVILAFFQFAVIISDNYTGLSNLFDSDNTPLPGKDIFSYDYVALESIRISDGDNNYWDVPRKSDEYYQLQLAANEILKQFSSKSLQLISKNTWDDLLDERYVMFQYYCPVPLSFVSSYSGSSQNGINIDKIYQMMFHPDGSDLDFFIFDGGNYFQLSYDATNDHLLNSIDYDNIFSYIKYTNFYDENAYKLLGYNPLAYQLKGSKDVKLYTGAPIKYQLAINVLPQLIAEISSTRDTYDLKEIKSRLLGIMQDRFTASLGTNQKIFFSNMENQFSVSSDGRITYDYFGKQNNSKGNVDMAYNKALSMLEKVLGLMDEKTSTTLVLTDIDYSNSRYYTFCFDYLVEGGKLVYITDDPNSINMQHAFTVQANQDNVIKLNGYLRTILTDKQTMVIYENDSLKLFLDHGFHMEDHYIEKIYNGYIMNVWSGSSTLSGGMLVDYNKKLAGIPMVILNFSSIGGDKTP